MILEEIALIVFYLLFWGAFGGFIVATFTGSWLPSYSRSDLVILYFTLSVAYGIMTFAVFQIIFLTPIV